MLHQPTLWDLPNATFSPESADGALPCSGQAGQQTDPFGQARARVSHFPARDGRKASKTPAISGPCSPASSRSAALQSSLESRLTQLLDTAGSMEYALTWKPKVTRLGRQYCQLAASVRPIAETDSGGPACWPTNTANNATGSTHCFDRNGGKILKMPGVVHVSPWPTPSAQGSAGETSEDLVRVGSKWMNAKTGRVLQEAENPDGSKRIRLDQLPRQCALGPWSTPRVVESAESWETKSARTARHVAAGNTKGCGGMNNHQQAMLLSIAPTESTAGCQLNPYFSAWMMGYPLIWTECAIRAMAIHSQKRKPSRSAASYSTDTATQSTQTLPPSGSKQS